MHKAAWTSRNCGTKYLIDHTMIAKEYGSLFMKIAGRSGAGVKGAGLKVKLKERKSKEKERSNKIG